MSCWFRSSDQTNYLVFLIRCLVWVYITIYSGYPWFGCSPTIISRCFASVSAIIILYQRYVCSQRFSSDPSAVSIKIWRNSIQGKNCNIYIATLILQRVCTMMSYRFKVKTVALTATFILQRLCTMMSYQYVLQASSARSTVVITTALDSANKISQGSAVLNTAQYSTVAQQLTALRQTQQSVFLQ